MTMMKLMLLTISYLLVLNLPVVSSLCVTPTVGRSRTTELRYLTEAKEDLLTFQQSDPSSSLVGGQILKEQYVVGRAIPVASEKCEIYEAFHICDPHRQRPMIIKVSNALENIETEYRVYKQVAEVLEHDQKDFLAQIYDKIDMGTKYGIVMEQGEDNLRFWIQNRGGYRGDKLKSAMSRVIRIVAALHMKGLVWTEIKAENFIIKDGTIKAIDLESVIQRGQYLRMYTAEACPPEFPIEDLHVCLPEMQPCWRFDMWGLGMVLFEMATGKPFYKDGLTNLEFIKEKLRNIQEIEPYLDKMLWAVDPDVRRIIKSCLTIDPRKRVSCDGLLKDPYFAHQKNANVEPSFNGEMIVTKFAHARLQKEEQGMPSFLKLDRLEAVLDAINEVAKQDPDVARDFLRILLEQTPSPQAQAS